MPVPMTMHVVFKTHLDVGFTDFAAAVKRRYFDEYLPRALSVARGLREAGGRDRMIWTTGSWLLYEYLEHADAGQRRTAEEGILAGDVRWHGLPFTMHSELLDPGLFRYGLAISGILDRRFGVRTIAAKMTDVPGHTRGIVPLMAEAGLRFLHLGVNAACRAPEVPPVFRWREPETGAELLVMYHASGYGGVTAVDGLNHCLAFAHTDDNEGPPSRDGVIETLAGLRRGYPQCEPKASTLDAFAAELMRVSGQLPVIDEEIGDTWIYGTASDPLKTAGFRALLALRRRWLTDGAAAPAAEALERFDRELLMIAEHSWGLDQKMFLADYRNYRRSDFERARARDSVVDGIPEDFSFVRKYARRSAIQSYRVMEASWLDHRAHLDRAVAALGATPLAGEAARALAECVPALPTDGRRAGRFAPNRSFDLARFNVRFGADGSLASLRDNRTGTAWASRGHALGLVRYQTFSSADYDRFLQGYLIGMEDAEIRSWAVPDFGRLGLGPHDSESSFVPASVVGFRRSGDRFGVDLRFPEPARCRYGAPARLTVAYAFHPDRPEIDVEVCWFEKPASRLPEATWVSFSPVVEDPGLWEIEKLGRWISPSRVVRGGNRSLHGIGIGARIASGRTRLVVESRDAHLVAPGEPRMLRFDGSLPPLEGGMHFCLHTNLFGTNFPLWYGENGRFRFRLLFDLTER
jgi:hypothetical protein